MHSFLGKLYVIVEYCALGSIQSYLEDHRSAAMGIESYNLDRYTQTSHVLNIIINNIEQLIRIKIMQGIHLERR